MTTKMGEALKMKIPDTTQLEKVLCVEGEPDMEKVLEIMNEMKLDVKPDWKHEGGRNKTWNHPGKCPGIHIHFNINLHAFL